MSHFHATSSLTSGSTSSEVLSNELFAIWETSPLAQLPLGIVICDQQGTIGWANGAYCRTIGMPLEQILGTVIQAQFGLTELPSINTTLNAYWQGPAPVFPVRITTQGLPSIAEPLFLLSIEDLTELHQAQTQIQNSHDRFQAVIEQVSDLYFIHDLDGTLSYLAPQFTNFFGYSVESQLGQSFEPLVHPEDLATVKAVIEKLVQTGISHDNVEFRIRHQKGHWVWILASHSLLTNKQGAVQGIQGFVKNISDRKASEQLLQTKSDALSQALETIQKTQTQMIQSEKMSSLGQLVAGIAHEINNPVNFIYGNLTYTEQYTQDLMRIISAYQSEYTTPSIDLQILMEDIDVDYLMADLPKLVKSMQVGANRIREIVLSLRNFSRLDESEFKWAELHVGIDSTLMILQNRLKAKDARPEIQVHLDYGDRPAVECYAGQLNQVFMNLLSNAIDALEDDWNAGKITDPQIKVTIETQAHQVVIAIQDNGYGILPDQRSRLFDPFYTTKPVGKGTGMGLSISYQIVVDRHGGQLECHSEIGVGTTFVITLPIAHESTGIQTGIEQPDEFEEPSSD